MATFDFDPDFRAQESSKPRVSNIQFGDGYMARQTSGLNTDLKSWSLQFNNREVSEIDEITEFLEARGGTEAFDWIPPRAEDAITVICQEWSRSIDHGASDSLSCTFTEVAEPNG